MLENNEGAQKANYDTWIHHASIGTKRSTTLGRNEISKLLNDRTAQVGTASGCQIGV